MSARLKEMLKCFYFPTLLMLAITVASYIRLDKAEFVVSPHNFIFWKIQQNETQMAAICLLEDGCTTTFHTLFIKRKIVL